MVITRLNFGGTETYILSLAQALRKLGVGVGIATMGGPLVPICKEHNIPVHILPGSAYSPPGMAAALARIATGRYQIIQLHDSQSFLAAAKITSTCGLPVILTVHGTYHQRRALTEGAKHAQALVAVSTSILSWVKSMVISTSPLTMILNGIDTAHFSPSSHHADARAKIGVSTNAQLLLYASRFDFHKQAIARKVMAAAEQIAHRYPHLRLILIGPGPYRLALQQVAVAANRRLGRPAFEVRPRTRDIRTYYQAADLVIATGRTAMEAMSTGKAVIASGIRGYEGILRKENMGHAIRTGFGDHAGSRPLNVRVLAEDMERLISNPLLRKALGDHNRRVVQQRFALDGVARQWMKVYRSLIR